MVALVDGERGTSVSGWGGQTGGSDGGSSECLRSVVAKDVVSPVTALKARRRS